MRFASFATLAGASLVASSVLAQTTTPSPAPGTSTGGIADWWWIILIVFVIAAVVWYFAKGRTRRI
jgi:hypothetical protein